MRLRVLLERQASILVQRLGVAVPGYPRPPSSWPRSPHEPRAGCLDFGVLVRRSATRAQRVAHLRARFGMATMSPAMTSLTSLPSLPHIILKG